MLFWDTSAVIPLVFREPNSILAMEASGSSSQNYAWNWLKIEAHAALARRNATDAQTDHLRRLLDAILFIDIPPDKTNELCDINRKWKLRAADAAHLFCFQQAALVLPDLRFVCFDDEIRDVALKNGFNLWEPSSPSPAPRLVREKRGRYGR